jgi:hypothetical protein
MSDFAGLADLLRTIIERGDLAHLALFLWAGSEFLILFWVLRELIAANLRFDLFLREMSALNERLRDL